VVSGPTKLAWVRAGATIAAAVTGGTAGLKVTFDALPTHASIDLAQLQPLLAGITLVTPSPTSSTGPGASTVTNSSSSGAAVATQSTTSVPLADKALALLAGLPELDVQVRVPVFSLSVIAPPFVALGPVVASLTNASVFIGASKDNCSLRMSTEVIRLGLGRCVRLVHAGPTLVATLTKQSRAVTLGYNDGGLSLAAVASDLPRLAALSSAPGVYVAGVVFDSSGDGASISRLSHTLCDRHPARRKETLLNSKGTIFCHESIWAGLWSSVSHGADRDGRRPPAAVARQSCACTRGR
jgi:hypothetical protein